MHHNTQMHRPGDHLVLVYGSVSRPLTCWFGLQTEEDSVQSLWRTRQTIHHHTSGRPQAISSVSSNIKRYWFYNGDKWAPNTLWKMNPAAVAAWSRYVFLCRFCTEKWLQHLCVKPSTGNRQWHITQYSLQREASWGVPLQIESSHTIVTERILTLFCCCSINFRSDNKSVEKEPKSCSRVCISSKTLQKEIEELFKNTDTH